MSQEITEIRKQRGATIITRIFPLTIELNKEYFRERFAKVLKEWDQTLWYGIDKELQDKFLNDLMKCFDEGE
jgi:hypothetical protein